jgi:hypothetical protein
MQMVIMRPAGIVTTASWALTRSIIVTNITASSPIAVADSRSKQQEEQQAGVGARMPVDGRQALQMRGCFGKPFPRRRMLLAASCCRPQLIPFVRAAAPASPAAAVTAVATAAVAATVTKEGSQTQS